MLGSHRKRPKDRTEVRAQERVGGGFAASEVWVPVAAAGLKQARDETQTGTGLQEDADERRGRTKKGEGNEAGLSKRINRCPQDGGEEPTSSPARLRLF